MPVAKVFLSSAYREMREYRDAAAAAIQACGYYCVKMEDFAAEPWKADDVCSRKVRECELMIFLIGRLYGSLADEQKRISYTEREFQVSQMAPAIPHLVFCASPKAQGNLAETLLGLRAAGVDVNEQLRLQDKFSKTVAQGVKPNDFDDGENLKFWISQSLNAWNPAPRTDPAIQVADSEMLPLLCDRSDHITDFGTFFAAVQPRSPQIYVLHGPDDERPESCVKRLVCFHLRYRQKIPVQPQLVEWPGSDEPKVMLNRLLPRLFWSLKRNYVSPDYSPAAFCRLLKEIEEPFCVFRHVIYPSRWGSLAQRFLRSSYLAFWDEVAKLQAQPLEGAPAGARALVFFEFVHPAPGAPEAEGFNEAVFHRSLRRFFERLAGCPAKVLPPLSSVDMVQLLDWYSEYRNRLPAIYRDKEVAELFPQAPLSMKLVERKLRDLFS